ncbi:MAG: hypothetical protein JWR29_1056 [Tardiphaga sp.]|nr:hypothetical protein [Tardiphaga sp.]
MGMPSRTRLHHRRWFSTTGIHGVRNDEPLDKLCRRTQFQTFFFTSLMLENRMPGARSRV